MLWQHRGHCGDIPHKRSPELLFPPLQAWTLKALSTQKGEEGDPTRDTDGGSPPAIASSEFLLGPRAILSAVRVFMEMTSWEYAKKEVSETREKGSSHKHTEVFGSREPAGTDPQAMPSWPLFVGF